MSRLLNVTQAAEYLGIGKGTLREGGAGTNRIPKVRLGRQVRWDRQDLDAFIEEQRQKGIQEVRKARRQPVGNVASFPDKQAS